MRPFCLTVLASVALVTAAFCCVGDPAPSPQLRAAVVDAAARALVEEYIFPDKAAEMERLLRRKLEAGDYDAASTLADLLRTLRLDLLAVSNDRHIALWEMSEADKQRQEVDDAEEMRSTNHGFRRLEVLPGNVGYLDIRIFDSPRRAAATADAAMALLADVDALIVDLRFNGGGEGYMVTHLLSYLYADNPVHHLDSRYRDHVDQFWTESHVPGRNLSGIPLYVLTSNGTFSAAEDFAYGLKTHKRATIVGEATRGGAHPVTYRFFKDLGVEMMIPNAESISPISGGNWEGTGVAPDVPVPEVKAFATAYLAAVSALLEKERDEGRRRRLERALKRAKADLAPPRFGADDLEMLAGTYGTTRVVLDDGRLYVVRDERSRYRLIPLTRELFRVESGFAEFEFTRDAAGHPTALVRTAPDGSRSTSPRAQSQ
jgi:retinol-binding protein 3